MFLNEMNSNECLKIFQKALDIGINAKTKNNFIEKNIDELKLNQLLETPINGEDIEQLLKHFQQDLLPYCSNFGNPRFMGFPDAGNSVAGITGAILADFLQQNLINKSFCAPIATYLEIAVIKWLREIIGYKIKEINNVWDVGGIITYGGTGSNTTALMLARENHIRQTMINGVKEPSKFKTIIPKGIGHYSIKSASMWLGLGDNVIEVDTIDFRYDLQKLKQAILDNKGDIMCVVVYVGDSRTMTIENLSEVYRITKEIDKNIWLHADACHGFSLAFSQKLRNKLKDFEMYDSISTDPHKVLDLPYCLSALLVKNPETFKYITSTSDLIMQEDYALGQITPFVGSKSWVSLKLWFLIKNLGIKGIAEMIENRVDMAQILKNKILKDKDFALINDVDINSVVFMYMPKKMSVTDLNLLNKQIHERMIGEGLFHLHQFSLNDNKGKICKDEILYPLRYMSGNPNISHTDLDDMLKYVKKLGGDILNEQIV